MMRFAFLAGTCLTLIPVAAVAQTAPAAAPAAAATPTVGATVLDSDGVVIGTIASITPQAVVLDMAGTKVAVPPTSIGSTPKGLAMAMTKSALQAAQAQQQASAASAVKARLVAGAPVAGLNGTPVGTIKSTSGDMVTLTTSSGEATLPASGFTANASGQLIIGLTQEQLKAAIGGNGGAAASSSATPATTTSTGVTSTAGATGSEAMTPSASPATTTTPTPTATPTTASTKAATTKKKTKRK